jgi:competence ComEA-like helix-hairpin-helix protein
MRRRIDSLVMGEEKGESIPGDRGLRPDAQTRGLALLIGAALLAAGLAQFVARLPKSAPPVAREFVFEDVQVVVPTFESRGPVDVNTASIDELVRLPGIGEALASRIVAYREEHGPFGSVDDLRWVSGIGPATIERFRDGACVGPPDQ